MRLKDAIKTADEALSVSTEETKAVAETAAAKLDNTHPMAPQEALGMGMDRWALTPAEMKEYGIEPGEGPYWLRNPARWAEHELDDRAREFLRGHPGRRIILKNGKPVCNADFILGVRSREEMEAIAEADKQAVQDLQRRIERETGDIAGVPRATQQSLAEIDVDKLKDQARQAGWIGPTSGFSWQEVYRRKGAEAVAREEAHFRSMGMHGAVGGEEVSPEEAYQQFIADALGLPQQAPRRQEAPPRQRGRRTYAVGASIKDGKVVR
jgi:hypothetical protein